jgi:acyl-CoA reductase-like NAD-dependent aldehyde dehydrogenase
LVIHAKPGPLSEEARDAGGIVQGGERIAGIGGDDAYYVRPALCEMPAQVDPMLRESFAQILYVMRYSNIDDAISVDNAVGAGLSSCIFTLDMREAERFLSTTGSDCGIANVSRSSPNATASFQSWSRQILLCAGSLNCTTAVCTAS